MILKKFVLLTCLWLVVSSAAADDEQVSTSKPPLNKSDYKKSLSRDCAHTYTTTCLKLDIVSWVDKLNEEDDYSVLPGVSVVRENTSARANTADIVAELARDFPNDPNARLDAFLLKKVTNYLNSHSVRLNLFNKDAVKLLVVEAVVVVDLEAAVAEKVAKVVAVSVTFLPLLP